mmetsp:Transcript_46137/g.62752  ORF Transcript_46137/g.62752 Transcript_46137/m.62752 type:complete len:192 (+) Transcript_46137:2510-3085(+)
MGKDRWGGGSGRVFLKFINARDVRQRYKRNQNILENFQKAIDLMLLIADPEYWRLYAFAPDQVGVAVIGVGHQGTNAEDQYIHTDMDHPRSFGHIVVFEKTRNTEIPKPYPVSMILSMLGKTYLTIQPKSWGCAHTTVSEPLDLDPGQLMIFNGNFVHAGRAHRADSWRMHWYRPWRSVLFDMHNLYLGLC